MATRRMYNSTLNASGTTDFDAPAGLTFLDVTVTAMVPCMLKIGNENVETVIPENGVVHFKFMNVDANIKKIKIRSISSASGRVGMSVNRYGKAIYSTDY